MAEFPRQIPDSIEEHTVLPDVSPQVQATRHELGEVLEDVSRYDMEPLPFRFLQRHADAAEKLTWKDFDQDETGECVFLYRGLQYRNAEDIAHSAHRPEGLATGVTKEEVFRTYGTNDIVKICDWATNNIVPPNAQSLARVVLHTSRDRHLVEHNWGSAGSFITYKIPKAWLLRPENQPIQGNIGEAELDFFLGLPEEFVHSVEQKGEPVPGKPRPRKLRSPTGESDVLSFPDLPPPKDLMI